jgi:hypothetical protein
MTFFAVEVFSDPRGRDAIGADDEADRTSANLKHVGVTSAYKLASRT